MDISNLGLEVSLKTSYQSPSSNFDLYIMIPSPAEP